MPKPRRESTARADSRPAFNRPPGARAPAPSTAQDELRTPKRTTKDKAKSSPAPSPSPEKKTRRPSDRHRSSSGAGRPSPRRDRDRERERERERDRAKYSSGTSTDSGTHLLSSGALAKLNTYNQKAEYQEKYEAQKQKKKQYKNLKAAEVSQRRKRKKNRNVSGAILEEGRVDEKRAHRRDRGGGKYNDEDVVVQRRGGRGLSKKKFWWIVILLVVLLAIFIPVGVVVANNSKKSGDDSSSGTTTSSSSGAGSGPSNDCDANSTPESARGSYTDISTWMDTADFNCTYTNETVGGLSVMGLYSDWDDSKRANDNVPPLDEKWEYGKMPIRGINVGGWFSLEPFITPSIFNYPASAQVVDEYSLTTKLGPSAQRVIEAHYATFINKQSFADIRDAGLDHVRIPFPYWAVRTYEGDPYLPKVAWRYLLRAIEYCRQNGLRVNLDLHAAPGSQNAWAHSGRQGEIGWILGPNGALNAQRTLDIHDQLSKFFAQDRYKNVVAIYGLVNEPKMLVIPPDAVLEWNKKAIEIIRKNGIQQWVVFGDGFLSLDTWDNMFKDVDDKLVMDTHQYQIFNVPQLKLPHQDKINLACSGWTGIMVTSNNPETGWGPTLDGEWSQADNDCTPSLNDLGKGSRWAGTLDTGDPETSVLTPSCANPPCSCTMANGNPSDYTDEYRQFLQMYAEAQMYSFEQAWGWFYWTWKTESSVQWSWMLGLQAGILPKKAYAPSFKCDSAVPSFQGLR